MNYNYQKITQLLNFFASKTSNSRIQKLKAIKLIWAADRYHLRKYGRLVSTDDYVAMKYGPVGSVTKRIAEDDRFFMDLHVLDYAKDYVTPDDSGNIVISHKAVDESRFSKTDIEALEFAWGTFGRLDGFKIAKISHEYPEWLKFKDVIEAGEQKRTDIEPIDFFKNPKKLTLIKKDPFEISPEILESSEEIYTGAF